MSVGRGLAGNAPGPIQDGQGKVTFGTADQDSAAVTRESLNTHECPNRASDDPVVEGSNCWMHWLERLTLRVVDSDWTWVGLNWLRPPKHRRLGLAYIFVSSIVLGLPGVAAGTALIAIVAGRIDLNVCLWLLLVVTIVELLLNLLFAHFWNRRAKSLDRSLCPVRPVAKRAPGQ